MNSIFKDPDVLGSLIVRAIALIIGWVFCISCLIGAYHAGIWIFFSSSAYESKEAIGLLSALAAVWVLEHEFFTEKLNQIERNLNL